MTEFTRKTSFPTMPTGAPVRFVHAFTTDSGSNYHLHLNNYVEIYISGLVERHQYLVARPARAFSRTAFRICGARAKKWDNARIQYYI